jgi:hypothetical protein
MGRGIMVATVLETAVDARVSIAGSQFCFAKVINQSTTETIRNDEINCAHVDPEVEGDAAGRELNRFIILLDVTVPMLEAILPYIGTTAATGVYTSDLTLSSMAVLIDYGATTHGYAETWITRMVMRGGTSTMPVSVELHCMATEELDVAAPTFTPATMEYIYGFPGTTFTAASVAYDVDRFVFAVDRNLVFEWNGSRFITGVGRGKRQSLIATSTPYIAAKKSVYWSNKTHLAGRAISLLMTNGTKTITVAMDKARLNPRAPSIETQTESIRLPLTWEGRRQEGSPDTEAFKITIVTL